MRYLIKMILKRRLLWCLLVISAHCFSQEKIEFNTDVLDVEDRKNIDLSSFSNPNFIVPGDYKFILKINHYEIGEYDITFVENDKKQSNACITHAMVSDFNFKKEIYNKLSWLSNGECLDYSKIESMQVTPNLSTLTVDVSIPQAFLESTIPNWDPPSRWDEGVSGLLFDYNINGQNKHINRADANENNLSGNGTTGFNIGGWRFRADWQGQYDNSNAENQKTVHDFDWSRFYAWRSIPFLQSKFTFGEDYFNSDVFDSFRFTGMSLVSDDNMLPPNLRGYAPEISGVAKTNAKVTIMQQERVIYETQVSPGPFRISNLNQAVSGELDVKVTEQDGTVQKYTVSTASVPYLTRTGAVRYKLSTGKPSDIKHNIRSPLFTSGEFSWGIANSWSLYGGSILSDAYRNVLFGLGRDLRYLGAISYDISFSQAKLRNFEDKKTGFAYRVSYAKRFIDFDSQVTFAGYRFSEKEYLSMNEFLDINENRYFQGNSKELYTITFNKIFRELGLSMYLNYDRQTYWNQEGSTRYNLTMSQYFDLGDYKNLSVSLSAYRSRYAGENDNGVFISLSVPWKNSGTLSYNGSYTNSDNSNKIGYNGWINERDNYQINAGYGTRKTNFSGFYNHKGDYAEVSVNAGYQENDYRTLGFSLQGGSTLTQNGGALHRTNIIGGTRLLLDTDGVSGVPVHGNGYNTRTNLFGKAVVTDVNNYYRNLASIDLNSLNDNVEATKSVVQATLTEGAIGYRKFSVISGEKAIITLSLSNGATPPFGTKITNPNGIEVGLVGDNGEVYLSGISPGIIMDAVWNGTKQCSFTLPKKINTIVLSSLNLTCH